MEEEEEEAAEVRADFNLSSHTTDNLILTTVNQTVYQEEEVVEEEVEIVTVEVTTAHPMGLSGHGK